MNIHARGTGITQLFVQKLEALIVDLVAGPDRVLDKRLTNLLRSRNWTYRIIKGYDPAAIDHARKIMPYLQLAESAYELATGCDALVTVTPWNEFKQLAMGIVMQKMRANVLIDGRNLYQPADMVALGYEYRGVGHGYNTNGHNG